MKTRIYVLYGQYGILTSYGMYLLAQRLGQFGTVSTHSWNDSSIINSASDLNSRLALIGYSLGGNATAWAAQHIDRPVDLIVAYDPSRNSPLVRISDGEYIQTVSGNVKRALCYYNPYVWLFGGSRLAGSMVETVTVNLPHLSVCHSEDLHARTIQAIRDL